jgi:hypothetical protein
MSNRTVCILFISVMMDTWYRPAPSKQCTDSVHGSRLQGVRWVINREAANGICVTQQSQFDYIDQVRQLAEWMSVDATD